MGLSAGVWYLYILECKGGKLYAGISTDVGRRFEAHCKAKGAAYTRMNRPVRILGAQPYPNRSAATRAETALKKMPRDGKVCWAREHPWPPDSPSSSAV